MTDKLSLPFLCLPIIALCFSCKPNAEPPVKTSFKDSIASRYVHLMDSSPYHDSTTQDYKMLKAYVLNDTARLKKLKEILDYKKSDWEIERDSCFNIKNFDEIKGEEVYRFDYTAAFCLYRTVTTLVKSNDTVSVNTLVYSYRYGNAPLSCKLVEQDTISLDKAQWEKFEGSLREADLWGLKQENGDMGVDGTSLYVDGYRKIGYPNKRTNIYRWCPGNLPVLGPFVLLLKYCKTKKGCLTAL